MQLQYRAAIGQQRRQIKPPQQYTYMVAYALSVAKETVDADEPYTYTRTISNANSNSWLVAINEELVKPPERKKIVICKWIFKKK